MTGWISAAKLQLVTGIRFERLEHTGGGCYTAFAAGHAVGPFVERRGALAAHTFDLSITCDEESA